MWSQFAPTVCNDKLLSEIGLEIGLSEHVFHTLLTSTCSKLKVEKLLKKVKKRY